MVQNTNIKVKVKKQTDQKENIDYLGKLKETISIKHHGVYLSDLNLSDIEIIIDDYINDITILRIVNDIVNQMIEEVIDENKFDFCIPFE